MKKVLKLECGQTLHSKFKAYASLEGKTISQKLSELVFKYVEDSEKGGN